MRRSDEHPFHLTQLESDRLERTYSCRFTVDRCEKEPSSRAEEVWPLIPERRVDGLQVGAAELGYSISGDPS
jgi:hypothetical protein